MNKIFLFSVLICSQLQSLQNKPLDKVEIKITSNAFKDGELIPSKYTCDGVNVSPDLKWNKPNDKIKSVNLMITLINQANYLIDKLINSIKEKHQREGGLTEELYQARKSYRGY